MDFMLLKGDQKERKEKETSFNPIALLRKKKFRLDIMEQKGLRHTNFHPCFLSS